MVLLYGSFERPQFGNIEDFHNDDLAPTKDHRREITDEPKHAQQRQNTDLRMLLIQTKSLYSGQYVVCYIAMREENPVGLTCCSRCID